MKKVIMFAIVALLAAPGNIIMARKNTVSTIIKETRNEPLTFYVNITNRQTAKRTFKKSMKKAQKDMLDAYGDSISVDSIMSMLQISNSDNRLKDFDKILGIYNIHGTFSDEPGKVIFDCTDSLTSTQKESITEHMKRFCPANTTLQFNTVIE